MTPAYVGAAAVGGLYVARYVRGSGTRGISMTQMAIAAGTSAAAAFVAPGISASIVCPHSPGAPLVEATASAAVSWAVLATMSDMGTANMFVPVQVGAYLAGSYASKYMRAWQVQRVMASAPDEALGMSDMD